VDNRELLAPDPGPLGRTRGRVLDLLRDSNAALTAADVARHCGLHQNTARFHLDALVEAALAVRDPEHRPGAPGRPTIGYRAPAAGMPGMPRPPAGGRRYQLLAQMLASLVAGLVDDPAATAERTGREWGGYLTEAPPPYQRPSAHEALTELARQLTGIGFAPQVDAARQEEETGGSARVLLRECPFREVAREHEAVVCSLHLGMIRGALDRMHAPLTADRLEVFPEPGLCRVRLSASRDR
jgi:predicted ArsR family transcriptional regulator